MSKLVYSMSVSLDGLVETPSRSLDCARRRPAALVLQRRGAGDERLSLRAPDVRVGGRLLAHHGGRPIRDARDARVRSDLEGHAEARVLEDARAGRMEQPA